MRIHNNIAAFNTHNRLKANQSQLNKTLEKLSSGYRINRAGDDAAGLTISEGMRAQIRGLQRANYNVQDGLSYVNTVDAVAQEGIAVLQRMRELTVQSLNDTLTAEDRAIIQEEMTALTEGLNAMATDTRYNDTLKAVESYTKPYIKVEGIRKFDGPVAIIPGMNDQLVVHTNTGITSFTIPSGNYDSIEQLADVLDSSLMETHPHVMISTTADHRLAIQLDDATELLQLKGSGAGLFMDYKIGNKPGMIIGTTDFSTGDGKLHITAGQNDTMSFYFGQSQKLSVSLAAGAYTRQQIIDEMNQQLAGTGVEATAYGDKNISLVSKTLPVTGLSGNMFKVDAHTSVFYDNIAYGEVTKTRSSFYGANALTFPLTFDVGDAFSINAVNRKGQAGQLTIKLAESAPQTFQDKTQFVSYIQQKVDAANLDITVSIQNNRLHFQSNFWGAGRDVSLGEVSSTALRNRLFTKITEVTRTPTITLGTEVPAKITGYRNERNTLLFDSTNNELTLLVDNHATTYTIPSSIQTPQQLVDELNAQFVANGLDVAMSYTTSSNKISFQLTSTTSTLQLANSSALQYIFGGQSVTSASIIQGRDGEPVYPTEGTVGAPEIEKFAAVATGAMSLSTSITVPTDNKTIAFTLNGVNHSIELTEGTYTRTNFLAQLNTKLTGIGVSASIVSSKLVLTTAEKGLGTTLTNVSGFGMDYVQNQSAPTTKATQSATFASIKAGPLLEPKTIDNSTNEMKFQFEKDGSLTNVVLTLEPKYYNKSTLIEALNAQLKLQNLHNDMVFKESASYLQLTSLTAGSNVKFSAFEGPLYEELFRKYTYTTAASHTSGTTSKQVEAYAVGRQDIDTVIEIFPATNDVLTFDLQRNGTKHTIDVQIPAGSYTGTQLTAVFNESLKKELQKLSLPEDLLEARIGAPGTNQNVSNANKFVLMATAKNDGRNDNGTIIIEGVRGSASYTFFYQATGLPEPSYVTGMVDLSNGLTITAGVNDQLSMEIDNKPYDVTFPPGTYDSTTLLQVINTALNDANTGLIASYSDHFLRLSYKEDGMMPIDGFSGNARDALMFPTEIYRGADDLTLQIGANEQQTMSVKKVALSDKALRIHTLDVRTRAGGEKALKRIDEAILNLTDQLSTIGAVQNRLEHVFQINENTHEQLMSAESKIRDADMAKEMMHMVKQDLLAQSATAMLAQAKKAPQAILQLLN